MTEKTKNLEEDFVNLARLSISGRAQDLPLFIQKTARKYRVSMPDMAEKLLVLLKESPGRSSSLRREQALPLPVDVDSRLQLVRLEEPLPNESYNSPIFPKDVDIQIRQLIEERINMNRLIDAGLTPTRTALFVGPPGVGKTMSARYLANALKKKLLILDLSAVMSSFLGRTGNNIRAVIDYAKSTDCILFLDELDAIAKRRDDSTEVGELKRLVTVILQEVDDWPAHGLLIAATNHPDLLDPAIWRRFDAIIEFPKPDTVEMKKAIHRFMGGDKEKLSAWEDILAVLFENRSFSDIEKYLSMLRRRAVALNLPLEEEIADSLKGIFESLPSAKRIETAEMISAIPHISQRKVSAITGVSRDTLRKRKGDKE